jgi:hypothetical protein
MCAGCNGHGEPRHRERVAIIGRLMSREVAMEADN